jgi:hypothetical protein
MVTIIVLLTSFAILRLAGFLGVTALDNWYLSLRIALFLMFLVTASAHWGRGRPDLIRMVPTRFASRSCWPQCFRPTSAPLAHDSQIRREGASTALFLK